jgi:hypothetical protein
VPERTSYLRAALLMPANLLALAAGGLASFLAHDWLPLVAAASGSAVYLTLLSFAPSFRRAVRANLAAQEPSEVASEEEIENLLAELAPSQKQHYLALRELRDKILQSYQQIPGGRVMAASSEHRLDALLTSFLRLLGTLNSYRKYLSAADRKTIEEELHALETEAAAEESPRLKEVKTRRAEILRKRVQRFQQAAESREVVSHQLASIEDVLRLTHEQSIAIRDPEVVGRQLEALTAEVEATEMTVREMEKFMEFSDEIGPGVSHGQRQKA